MTDFEKTQHFFGDLIDLENTETGELVTMPGIVYRYLSGTMPDQEIFDQGTARIQTGRNERNYRA